MNRFVPFARRAHRRHRTEAALLLDGGVDFLVEDDWRSPLGAHPLSPRPRKPYGYGKQVSAMMTANSRAEEGFVREIGPEWIGRVYAGVAQWQLVEHRALQQRRVRAAESPLTVIEPQSSIPGVQRVVAELERRTHLPIEEIRGTFRQGRRSLEQQAERQVVEGAIIATYRHHRMIHPVFDRADELGTAQWKQAREVWREFIGQSLSAQRDRALAFATFGEYENDWDEVCPVEYGLEPEADSQGNRIERRAPRSQRKPQIVPRIAEAVGVTRSTIYRILETGRATDERVGRVSTRQEAS